MIEYILVGFFVYIVIVLVGVTYEDRLALITKIKGLFK